MKKRVLVFLMLLVLCICGLGAGQATKAEGDSQKDEGVQYIKGRKLTQEEIEQQKKHEPKNLTSMKRDKTQLKIQERNEKVNKSQPNETEFPSKYDSRSKNIITSVKDQGNSQWCWDYATISCAETSMIKNGVTVDGVISTTANTDLSEGALAYFLYNRTCTPDPLGGSQRDENIYTNNMKTILDYGGIPDMAYNFLSTWMGVKKESFYSVDTYNASKLKKPNIKKAYKENAAILKNVYWLNGHSKNIKQAVINYGAVATELNWDNSFFNYNTAAYCNINFEGGSHAVTIVGWNDNYSYKNFAKSSKVKKNGAWIVKNSWSDKWGDDGYFYVSYEDVTCYPVCAVEMQSKDAYDHNYFYDGTATTSGFDIPNGSKIANVFTAHGNKGQGEILESISFQLLDNKTKYSVQVYTDIKDTKNPISGTKALETPVSGVTDMAGQYTIPLNKEISLSEGTKFSVVVTLESTYYEDAYVATDETSDYGWVKCNASIMENQSFKYDAKKKTWSDLSKMFFPCCARIKAYTTDKDKERYQVVFKNGNTVVSTQYIEKGKSAITPKVSKTGYTFSKWDNAYTNVQSDLVVKAVWTANKYIIKFNANGGKNTMGSQTCYYGTTYKLKSNAFTRSGYSFIGWNTKKDGKGTWYQNKEGVKNLTNKSNGVVTLYAKWAKKTAITSLKSLKAGQFTIKYAKTDSAQTGYQILYSTSKSFSSKTTKTVTVKGYKNVSKTITGLTKGKTYYVKVRTYKTVGKTNYYGSYTSAKTIKIKK